MTDPAYLRLGLPAAASPYAVLRAAVRALHPDTRAARGEYSTALGHLFHEHVASHSMTCGHPREVICEAVHL